jgi:hypothetical protein
MAAGRRVKTGLGGLRSIAYDALERTCVRALASATATALDRRCHAIERTNWGFAHFSPNLLFKPRLHNKDLQHNKTLK